MGLLAGAIFFVLTGAGCLDIEKQTILVVFPKDGKEIKALFVYQGLSVGETDQEKAAALDRAKDDLGQLVRGETFYMAPSFMFRVYLKPGQHDEPKAWDIDAMKVLNKHIVLGKGVFVMGKDGDMSYCQPLTVRDPEPFVTWLNQVIAEQLLDEIREAGKDEPKAQRPLKRGKEKKFDAINKEIVKMVEQAVKDGFRFLRLEPGRICFNFPGNPKLFPQLKRELFLEEMVDGLKEDMEDILDKAGKDKVDGDKFRKKLDKWESDVKGNLKMLADAPWSIEQRRDRISLVLGWGDNHPFRLPLDLSGFEGYAKEPLRRNEKDLVAFARTLGAPVRSDVSVEDFLEAFERTQTLEVPRKK
jgi:hypothetical protein